VKFRKPTDANILAIDILSKLSPSQIAVMVKYKKTPNLSNYTPTFAETIILRKGLKFVPTTSTSIGTAKATVVSAISKLHDSFAWAGEFKTTSSNDPVIKKLLSASTARLPSVNAGPTFYLTQLQTNICKSLDVAKNVKWNYKKCDMKAFAALCQRSSIDIVTRDKNLGVIILPISWRKNETTRQISDVLTYAPASFDMIRTAGQNIMKFIIAKKKLFKSLGPNPLSDREYEGLLNKTREALVMESYAQFTLTCKTHKVENLDTAIPDVLKGRPLLGAYACPTTYISALVAVGLKPFIADEPTILESSKSLLQEFAGFQLPPGVDPSEVTLATADVESLYPSIPIVEGCALVKEFLISKIPEPKQPCDVAFVNLLVAALLIVLQNNIFKVGDDFFLQLRGTAMGTNCAPIFAVIFLLMLERKLDFTGILLYRRYIDDLKVIARSRADAQRFMDAYNALHPQIKLEVKIGSIQNFLNLTIWWDKKLCYRPYAKDFNQFLFLPFSSHHPPHMKKAFIKSYLIVLVISCSSDQFFYSERQLFLCRLRDRGYPLSFLSPIFGAVKFSMRDQYLQKSTDKIKNGLTFLSLPYNALFAACGISTIIQNHWDLVKNDSKLGPVLTRVPMLAWTKDSTVSDKINSLQKTKIKDADSAI
jgi:hypothetical protein